MNALTVKSINGERFFMNYYEHHIGDYAEATSHLTFVEDAAYSRLIRKYYSTEKTPTQRHQACAAPDKCPNKG
jgi:uncharacterized protein YdaU (DUF1376 family)